MSERSDVRRVAVRSMYALVAALLTVGLSGCARKPIPPIAAGLTSSQADTEIERLTQQAVRHLQAQLEVQREDIAVESIQPLEPLCRDPDLCPSTHSGYLIRLMLDGLAYEYSARVGEEAGILWCEVPPTPMLGPMSP